MNIPFYLKVSSTGVVGAYKNPPSLGWNEISMFVRLDIPDRIFDKPTLQANITIPEEAVIKTPIEASVVDNVAEAIEQATGLKFNITVEKKEEEEQNE